VELARVIPACRRGFRCAFERRRSDGWVTASPVNQTLNSTDGQLRVNSMTVTLKDFYADWCGPCKTQDPILDDLEEDWEGRFQVEKVNVDEEQDVANEYQVRSLPTLVIENDDGIVERFVGVTQREDIEDALEQAGA
jgi:thioredoxin 1